MTTNESIGRAIKARLEKDGVKQKHFAQNIGMSQELLARKINGFRKFNLDDLRTVCVFFGIKMSTLFREAEAIEREGENG